MRAALRHFANVLIVAGVLLLADAGADGGWQEPMSAYLAHRQQGKLSKSLVAARSRLSSTPLERRALSAIHGQSARIAFLARSLRRRVDGGGALGRIEIPKVGASFVFVDGTNTDDLRKGPGLYEQTPMPGVGGTVAIAGHRTTYLAPFRHIDQLNAGDTIRLELPYGVFMVLGRKAPDRQADGALGHASRRSRPPRPVRLPPSVQRLEAHRRVRSAGADGSPRRALA